VSGSRSRLTTRVRWVIPLAAAAAMVPAGPAAAVIFEVNATKDKLDANLADDTCAAANGKCTLRAAVGQANHTAGNDEIILPAGTFKLTRAKSGAISNDEGDLDITQAVTFTGAGRERTQIVQTVPDRVLRTVAPNDKLSAGAALAGVTLRGGRLRGGRDGGGIYNDGELALDRVAVRDNTASGKTGDLLQGAGIYLGDEDVGSLSPVTIQRSLIRNNATKVKGGGTAEGGGIYVDDGTLSLSLSDSRVLANEADRGGPSTGGGISIGGGEVTIARTTIARNSADFGGGIDVWSVALAPLELSASTVTGNVAADGSALHTNLNGGIVTVENSTLSRNEQGRRGRKGVVYSAGDLTLNHVTIAGNKTKRAIIAGLGTVAVSGSIVTGEGPDCSEQGGAFAADSYNLFGDESCPAGSTNLVADPLLRPLAGAGGPTATMALRAASPAIDHVTGECPPPATDQRGVLRPQGSACDAGAFEREAP
jgi:hypothetical protein